jgi:hypothetical protein
MRPRPRRSSIGRSNRHRARAISPPGRSTPILHAKDLQGTRGGRGRPAFGLAGAGIPRAPRQDNYTRARTAARKWRRGWFTPPLLSVRRGS